MKAERLLELYDRISEAPDAVSRLRRFVLDLAVRGRLVEQDLEDEPAFELRKRIDRENSDLTGNKVGRKYEGAEIAQDEYPFEVPNTWAWVRLAEIVTKLTDGTHRSPPNGPRGDFKYITAKNIKNDGVSLENITYVSREVHEEIYSRCNPEKGDILYIKDGATTGIATVNNLDEPFSMLSSVALLKLPSCVFNRLIVEFLRSPFFYDQMRSFMKGAAITRVTLKRMAPALVPLPPLAEQHRIVAKVDELMALCHRLEEQHGTRETTRDRLTTATLSRLTAPDTDEQSFRDQARFALDTLPAITARPDQLTAVRQTILDLAMRGKLVEQDPEDEPASELIERIEAERKQAGIKSSQLPLDTSEVPVPLPDKWSWVRVGEICTKTGSGSTPRGGKSAYKNYGIPFLRSQNVHNGGLRLDDVALIDRQTHDRMSGTKVLPGDLLLNITGGSIGRCCRVPNPFDEANVSQHVAIIRPAVSEVGRFLHWLVLSPYFQAFVSGEQTGGVHHPFCKLA